MSHVSLLNRSSAPAIMRLFDYCFKQGVLEAAAYEDDYSVKEWMNERKEKGDYGLISEMDAGFDWKRWRFTLYRWCRDIHLTSLAENYVDTLRHYQSNAFFAVLPLSMRFYLMGVEEWLEYPNPIGIKIFKQTPKIHWKPVPSHLKKMTSKDMLSLVQEFVYERESKGYEGDMINSRYDTFCFGLWRCMQKYPTYAETKDAEG